MKIEFIGVGEAFDPILGNASYLLHSKTNLLVDCGYAVPRNYLSMGYPPDFLDAIYVTHFHADHYFGIPHLLGRWHQDGRKKPLLLIGQPGIKKCVHAAIDLGYPNCRDKLEFKLQFLEGTDPLTINELNLTFAPTSHPQSNYAVVISCDGKSVGFSGDGGLTKQTRELFLECRVLVHEAYKYDQVIQGHTTALESVEYGT